VFWLILLNEWFIKDAAKNKICILVKVSCLKPIFKIENEICKRK